MTRWETLLAWHAAPVTGRSLQAPIRAIHAMHQPESAWGARQMPGRKGTAASGRGTGALLSRRWPMQLGAAGGSKLRLPDRCARPQA